MGSDIVLKSKFPRDVLNEIKWKGYNIDKCKVYYINRGSPGDVAVFEGERIIETGSGFLTLKGVPYEIYIPYHRIIRIEYEDCVVFDRPERATKARNKNMSSRDEFKINALRDLEFLECTCNDCGNKFKGLPVKNVICSACHSSNITKN